MKSAYPNNGYHWMADNSNSTLWISSDDCDPAEQAAINRTQSQTSGSSAISGTWPDGIKFYVQRCDGGSTINTDVRFDYLSTSQWNSLHGSQYTGHNHDYFAPASYCTYWNHSYPCGKHLTRLHINRPRLNSFTATTQRNILMHELTHVEGFFDVCSSNVSLSSNCDLDGQWYYNDLDALKDHIYPNWKY